MNLKQVLDENGFAQLSDVARAVVEDSQRVDSLTRTLRNWATHKPKLLTAVVMGAKGQSCHQ